MRSDVRLLLPLVLSAFVLGCALPTSSQPGDVVAAAYLAANSGRYEEADQHLTSDLKQIELQDGGPKVVWDNNTRGRRVQSLRVQKTTIGGDSAQVLLQLTFVGGCTDEVAVELHRKWSGWLISRISSDPGPTPCGGVGPRN